MPFQVFHKRFTVQDYYRMAEAGILTEDDRVELIDGEIVEMSPVGSQHAGCVDRLNRMFNRACQENFIVRVQGPVRLDQYSEPEPDVAILKPRPDYYTSGHPGPAEVMLIIEVADTTADYDRQVKMPLYARAGIELAWLVDLPRQVIEVYSDPQPDGYARRQTFHRGDHLSLPFLPGVSFAVEDILR
ncbi:MAG: Uma2 family endonuclease [Calditrichaeota bacterium]|nr:MAG: Uma2 family endonuclease [Calditrichota bacterium]